MFASVYASGWLLITFPIAVILPNFKYPIDKTLGHLQTHFSRGGVTSSLSEKKAPGRRLVKVYKACFEA